MAALFDQYHTPLVDLRDVTSAYLEPLLQEETEEWRTELDWDYRPSADLVRRFVDMRALTGFTLTGAKEAAGYGYYVCEEGKGLIGGLYIGRRHRTLENENTLLTAILDAMWRIPGTRRVEVQLMMLSSPLSRSMPYPRWVRAFPRKFFEASLEAIRSLPPREPKVAIAPWSENRQEDAARLIAASYAGHVDSHINDQYRSASGARRFLTNIVQYPGCGTFFAPASCVAVPASGRGLYGVCLTSLVARDVGHITQVCVAPAFRGTGLGYELLRRSLLALADRGCRTVSLTVTTSNASAIELYERMGFVNRRDFAAYVWEIK
ncbi:MAG: GCN5-related N-acetyltransferase [Bryobacterales bacterium]|nr:GCN5-related N-acetyltransferase [Bryobacterales bacterium]